MQGATRDTLTRINFDGGEERDTLLVGNQSVDRLEISADDDILINGNAIYSDSLDVSADTIEEISLKPLFLRRFTKEDNGSMKEIYEKSVAGLPTFNPINKTLRLVARAGGADCGSYLAEYKYEGDNLDLLVLKVNLPCVRRKDYNPDQYPVIYPWQK